MKSYRFCQSIDLLKLYRKISYFSHGILNEIAVFTIEVLSMCKAHSGPYININLRFKFLSPTCVCPLDVPDSSEEGAWLLKSGISLNPIPLSSIEI